MAQRLNDPALPTSTPAGPGLHRRSELQRSAGGGPEPCRPRRPGSGPSSPSLRDRPGGRGRGVLSSRWQLLMLVAAGLLLHSMVAKRTQPWLAASGGSLVGGVAIRGMSRGEGGAGEGAGGEGAGGEGGARSRSLVEQPASRGAGAALSSLAAALVRRSSPPPSPIPQAWLEGGTLGQWPKPYRNKTRQVVPNSISQWRCTPDAANFSLAAATHNPLLQSTEWREKYGDDVSLFRWCREGLPEEVPQLQPVLQLRSAKPRPERGLTVVTQLSLERFQMLDNQCSTWPLQISAVLYIPLLKGRIFSAEEPAWNKRSLDVGIAESLKFFAAMEASNSSCILDLEVVVEERCDRYSAMLYPANAARNRALVNANTEALLLVDVDFAVSRSLADLVRGEASYRRLMAMLHNRNAVVLPAFETQDDGEAGRQVALEAVRRGKPYVVRKFEWNIVFGFHVPQYPQGHQATDYWRWAKSRAAYPVQYQIGYEPYIMMHRQYIPFYDERFRGYYWNKVQHLMHISLQNGFEFVVHPTAFVVHVPHKKPSTKWLTRKMGQKEKNHMLFDNALFHMRQMDFVPVTSWPDMCTPEAAPVLPDEEEIREVAAMKAAAERAAAEQAELLMQQHSALQEAAAAAAAKRAAEAAEAERWMSENAEAAAAADRQHQQAALEGDAAFLQAQQAHAAQLAAAAAGVAANEAAVAATAAAQAGVAAGEQQAAAQQAAAAADAQQAAAGGAEQAAAAGGAAQAAVAAGADKAAAGAGAQQATAAAGAGQAATAGGADKAATAGGGAQAAQQAAAAAGKQQAEQQPVAAAAEAAAGTAQGAAQVAAATEVGAGAQSAAQGAAADQPAAGAQGKAAAAQQQPAGGQAAEQQPGGAAAHQQAAAATQATAQTVQGNRAADEPAATVAAAAGKAEQAAGAESGAQAAQPLEQRLEERAAGAEQAAAAGRAGGGAGEAAAALAVEQAAAGGGAAVAKQRRRL